MAVALPNDHKVRFYGSPDLKHWETLSDFGPAGAASGQWECPELFELPMESKPGQTRWVLKIGLNPGALQGGSGEQYFVGQFDGTRFVNDNPPALTLWTDYGKDCYCALTFNNLPRTQSPVMIGWMNNWQYAGDVPTHPWRGQMTVPRKLALRETSEGIRLVQNPVDALEQLRRPWNPESDTFEFKASRAAGERERSGLEAIHWRRCCSRWSGTIAKNSSCSWIERTRARQTSAKIFRRAPWLRSSLNGDQLRVHILVDRSSVEVFADDGRIAMTNLIFPPPGARRIEFYSKGGQAGAMKTERWTLSSIW